MRILVTGGSGYLGTHVRQFFDADDYSRRSGFDVLDEVDLHLISEYDVVIHLAAHLDKSPAASDQVFATNVQGTVNVLKNLKKDSVFIFASTKDIYGRFADNFKQVPETCPTLYAGQTALEWSKLVAERYVEFYANQNGFRSCIFRLSTVYAPLSEGNSPNFVGYYADSMNKGEPIRVSANRTPKRDLLHVNDLSAACRAFINSVIKHGLYNLGGGSENALGMGELIAKLEAVSGLQAVVDNESMLPNPVPLNYVSDISLVMQELDWKPTIGLDEGLRTLFQ